jgi:hypothetical protein
MCPSPKLANCSKIGRRASIEALLFDSEQVLVGLTIASPKKTDHFLAGSGDGLPNFPSHEETLIASAGNNVIATAGRGLILRDRFQRRTFFTVPSLKSNIK